MQHPAQATQAEHEGTLDGGITALNQLSTPRPVLGIVGIPGARSAEMHKAGAIPAARTLHARLAHSFPKQIAKFPAAELEQPGTSPRPGPHCSCP